MIDKLKVYAPWLVTAVLGIVLLAGGAKAAGGFSWEVVMEKVAEKIASRIPDSFIGAAEGDGTHLRKLTVNETLDASSTVTFSGALNVGGAFTQVGASTFTGAITSAGTFTSNGSLISASSTRAATVVETGSVVTLSTTTVLTAAQICNAGAIVAQPGSDSGINAFNVTMPNSSTLFADCMTTDGDVLRVPFVNQSALTGTLFIAGAGGPLQASSTLSAPLRTTRFLNLVRTSSIGYVLDIQ